jgi:hypothetical protein
MKIHNLCDNVTVHEYSSDIFIIKNLIPIEYCTQIISLIANNSSAKLTDYAEYSNVKCYETVISMENINEIPSPILLNHSIQVLINHYIPDIVSIINKVNMYVFDDVPNLSNIHLRKIIDATRLHTDNISPSKSRLAACVITLNSIKEGGVFSFPQQFLKLKLVAGDILIFPPYWTHPHEVSSPINGDRYTINFWFNTNNN